METQVVLGVVIGVAVWAGAVAVGVWLARRP